MTTADVARRDRDTAVLFAGNSPRDGMALGLPSILLPLHDKPMLQRAVEQLVAVGCSDIHVVLDDQATEVRAFL